MRGIMLFKAVEIEEIGLVLESKKTSVVFSMPFDWWRIVIKRYEKVSENTKQTQKDRIGAKDIVEIIQKSLEREKIGAAPDQLNSPQESTMNPDTNNHSKELEKDKKLRGILAGMSNCNQKIWANTQKILQNMFQMKIEANQINSFLEELKELLEKPEIIEEGAKGESRQKQDKRAGGSGESP